jgi:hypothetical protein
MTMAIIPLKRPAILFYFVFQKGGRGRFIGQGITQDFFSTGPFGPVGLTSHWPELIFYWPEY